jgi:hypothetical protein
MSCIQLEKLEFEVKIAKAMAEQEHNFRKLALESCDDSPEDLYAFVDDLVVEAEMKITRALTSLAQHTISCLHCTPANSN